MSSDENQNTNTQEPQAFETTAEGQTTQPTETPPTEEPIESTTVEPMNNDGNEGESAPPAGQEEGEKNDASGDVDIPMATEVEGEGEETPQEKPLEPATEKSAAPAPTSNGGGAHGGDDNDKDAQPVNKSDPEAYMTGVSDMIERKNINTFAQTFGGPEGLAELHGTDIKNGLPQSAVEEQRNKYGWNKLKEKEPVTFFEFLVEAFMDTIIQMLCVAAVISIIFGLTLKDPHSGKVNRETGWIEGVAIIISVAVVVLMGSVNNYQKAKKFEEMEADQAKKEVVVLRDGTHHTIDSIEVVVGDILEVESGIQFTCDCVYMTGTDLKCNESAMTGEPDIIKKNLEQDPFFISGTQLDDGAGRLFVVAVGQRSYQGVLKEALDEESEDTPLQIKLAKLADDIGKLGAVMAVLLLGGLILKEVILITTRDDHEANASRFLRFVIVAITIIVVAIPEGLPLAVTISLAFSMKAMMKDNCLVRILASCETMGGATAICSDKTGTLTENRMTVVQGYVFGCEFIIDGYALKHRNKDTLTLARDADFKNNAVGGMNTSGEALTEFCFGMAINSSARQEMREDPTEKDGSKSLQWVGNKTEHGLLGFCNYAQRDYNAQRDEVPEANRKQFPFNSSKKRMTTAVKGRDLTNLLPDCAGNVLIYQKGASELILEDCDRVFNVDGSVSPITTEKRNELLEVIESMANQGNRTIGVAVGNSGEQDLPEDEPHLDSLIFMGVMGIQDPIRQEVPAAVDDCESAGIRVRMVTGDNKNTAIAIAKKAHIYTDPNWDLAMTGVDFRYKYDNNKDELFEILPRLRVLARSSPSDKHKLVGMLQEMGDVVAVTGDGTNDAPALKLANVGFAMKTGTDIAKGAADMVLMDDNFASVVNACMWGRAVNDNIRKFLQYQLSINLGGVILTVVSALASEESKEVFAPVQLLWLNLIMDTFAALALATEKPERESLKRSPVFKQAPLLSNKMRSFIGVHSFFQTTVILLLFFLGHNWFQTIEEADECEAGFFYLETQWRNSTSNEIVTLQPENTTGWVFESSDRNTKCTEYCEHEGGTLDGRFCKQGRIHGTIIFNTFIFMQAFNIFNARRLYNEFNLFAGLIDRSLILLGIFFVICAFQACAVELFGRFMVTTGLTWQLWLICIGLGFIEIPLGVMVRLLPVSDFVPEEVSLRERREMSLREKVKESRANSEQSNLLVKKDPALKRTMSISKNPSMNGRRKSQM